VVRNYATERPPQIFQDDSIRVAHLNPHPVLGIPACEMVLREPHAALRIDEAREVLRRRYRKVATLGIHTLTPLGLGRTLHIELLEAPIESLTNSLLPFG